jgi:large subunit ribosomal protein L4
MSTVSVKTVSGGSAGTVDLAPELFGIQPNVPAMHQAVQAQLAHRRAGTQSTKTRAEVRGGGRKPFRQKGTGNARQGTTRAPQFSGGGVALGPKPRSYSQKVNKKVVRLALASALSDRASEGKVVVVDTWGWTAPKTKDAIAALNALGIDGTALVVVGREEEAVAKSFRNLTNVQLILQSELNVYDVLTNEYIVFSKATLPASNGAGATAPESESEDVAATPVDDAADEAPAEERPAVEEEALVEEQPVDEAEVDEAEAAEAADAAEGDES